MGDLGVVGAPLIFGLARGAGAFAGGLLTFALVSGFQVEEHNCRKYHFFRTVFPSQLETMVDGAPVEGFSFTCRLGCRWDYHRVWIACSHIGFIRGLLVC